MKNFIVSQLVRWLSVTEHKYINFITGHSSAFFFFSFNSPKLKIEISMRMTFGLKLKWIEALGCLHPKLQKELVTQVAEVIVTLRAAPTDRTVISFSPGGQ